jgi:hypothetical protein
MVSERPSPPLCRAFLHMRASLPAWVRLGAARASEASAAEKFLFQAHRLTLIDDAGG